MNLRKIVFKKKLIKSMLIFFVFQVIFAISAFPFNIRFGPFENIRVDIMYKGLEDGFYRNLARFFVSENRYGHFLTVYGGEKAGKENNSEKGDKTKSRTVYTNAKPVASRDKNIGSTQPVDYQGNVTQAELNKLGGQVIQKKGGKIIYEIVVSIQQQKVYIYDNRDQKLVKEFVCSTGKKGDETPTGNFTIKDRGDSFFNPLYADGAYYWVRFNGNYLFHSVPFDVNRKIQLEEAKKLGQPASHGCIRLTIENAKWIYDNIATGTTVTVLE